MERKVRAKMFPLKEAPAAPAGNAAPAAESAPKGAAAKAAVAKAASAALQVPVEVAVDTEAKAAARPSKNLDGEDDEGLF